LNTKLGCLAVLGSTLAALLSSPGSVMAQGSKYGQFAPPDAYVDGSKLAYYGSENQWSRRQFRQEKSNQIYGRRGQRQLLAILDGKPTVALGWGAERLQADPNDFEAMFTRTVAYCQMSQLDLALASMREAVEAGLPIERFLAGPRHLLKTLTDLPEFEQFAAERTDRLIHGPMLGCVTDQGARVWLRTWQEAPVTIRVFACDQQGKPTKKVACRASVNTDPKLDYTAILQLADLQPETQYAYQVQIAEQPVLSKAHYRFKTLAAADKPTRFKIAFGGGAGYTPEYERMWDTIASKKPDALLLLGDNVYIDLAEEPRGLHRYTYYRRQSRPEFRRLIGSTPVYAIWDDHDCGIDDVWMGPYLDRPSWKPAMLRVFKENWVNPAYGNSEEPGCWFAKSVGNIDFLFLDTRYFRTNPFAEHPTMLGPQQKEWLLRQLSSSTAAFKVLVSSVPWAENSKPGSHDTWDGFREEREEIFAAIAANKIDGVLLMSADRHRSDVRKIDRPDGYALYDMMSSKLTNAHTHECLAGALFCYNAGCSFGMLTLDTTAVDPTATYEVVDIDGEKRHRLNLSLSQLAFD